MLRLKTLLLALTVCVAALAAAPADYVKSENLIPMRDGVRLYTAVYAPKDIPAEGAPILLMRTPYGCRPYGAEMAKFFGDKIYKPYIEAGYIFAFQDVRGRWMSEGTFVNVRPLRDSGDGIDESTDSYDTIDWLVKNIPGNNGRVGVNGNSYCGFYALMAANSHHPALKAASPQAPVGDWYKGDDLHHNGALALLDAVSFSPQLRSPDPNTPSAEPSPIKSPVSGNTWQWCLSHSIDSINAMIGKNVPFWTEFMQHEDYDEWWQKRSSLNATHGIKVPVLIVGGLFDAEDLFGTWSTYRGLLENSPYNDTRIVMGPWSHGQWRGNSKANKLGEARFSEESLSDYFRDSIEFPFFEYFLRDRGNGGDTLAGDLVFFTGENKWHRVDVSKFGNGAPFTLLLNGKDCNAEDNDSTLVVRNMKQTGAFSEYISDPANPVPYYPDTDGRRKKEYMTAAQNFVDDRPDVLTFISAPLADTLRVAGPVTPTIYLAADSVQKDIDIIVKIIDVAPDTTELLVRAEISPVTTISGGNAAFTYTMPDIAHTFLTGHHVKVQIQSTWFPLFATYKQRHTAPAATQSPTRVTIAHTPASPTHITLHRH